MSLKYKLPITNSITQTFQRWASELRGSQPLTAADFKWKDYDPTITPTAPLTISSYTIDAAKYLLVGDVCFIGLRFTVITGGAGSNIIYVSMPKEVPIFEVRAGVAVGTLGGEVTDATALGANGEAVPDGQFRIFKSSGANFTAGGTLTFRLTGFFTTF